ncbi:MAG: BNR/Asp-box repeat protein [Chloroflexi bacterium]|nr:BNR/Asp-box repeat protein [Chloroflexota bacterium]
MRQAFIFTSLVIIVAMMIVLSSDIASATPLNVDVSQRHLNESEEAIAVNPTNPKNIVIVTNVGHREAGLTAGMFKGVSFDGGATWTTSIIGNFDNLGDSCCDPSLTFDEFGNLFMTYLYQTENTVPIALSTDGGLTFNVIQNITAPPKSTPTKSSGDNRGLFRFVDQPTITAAKGEVWVVFNAGGPLFATGAPVAGLGQVGAFFAGEVVPGSNNCTYGDIAIGPSGQIMQACNLTESGQGGGKVYINVDPDGLGPAGFGDRVFVAATHVGGFDFIPPQPDRSVDAEAGLAWDRTGGLHNGRVYIVYTKEQQNESDNTDIYVRYSDDNGATWSDGLRVNDDNTTNSQFLPKIALDQTTGDIAVVWYDSRNDLGGGGTGDSDGIANDDAQFWGAFSTNGGVSITPNIQISGGTSNSHVSGNGIDYGDYTGLSFVGGIAHPAWSDNSNSTGTNPDGAYHQLDIFTAAVPVTH